MACYSHEDFDSAPVRFKIGDIVDIKGHGRATVIEAIVDQPGHPQHGRYHIRYHEDNTTYWCRPKLMRLMHPTSKRVLVARHTHAYRDAMVHNIDRPDVCLEIGCHEGLTTNIISNRATFVAGIDTASEVVAIARGRHPHLAPHLHQLDGLDTAATRALSPCGSYNRICIDISGKAPLALICSMITAQHAAYPQASLIVKNEQLYDALVGLELLRQQRQGGQQQEGEQQQQQHQEKEQQQPLQGEQQGGDQEADAAAQLAALLGRELLAECELFRHQFRPPRTRPLRPREVTAGAAAGGAAAAASQQGQ
ncbi:hypothetical protein Agub_g232 [Astrephomene gubernaculifera]|uniref:Uncharacterized protein n=1 Tax=Astrephomene gubernaculifera TaxID=47775 RepID=A0AAD3DDB2_9CHLO|nr:hypothetical protein Agub_g232 [Astrephomene gubernaculifera]